jgi:hypothetical protein
MRRFLSGFCVVIVGLQILIGVPLAVCVAFFACVQNGGAWPMTVEIHAGPRFPATVPPGDYPGPVIAAMTGVTRVPPPNIIPSAVAPSDNPILLSRQEHGSPLAGTVFAEETAPEEEQRLFLTALEKAAVEAEASCPEVCTAEFCPVTEALGLSYPCESTVDVQVLGHLYSMAELDEEAGNFERADQWRALARELRSGPNNELLP